MSFLYISSFSIDTFVSFSLFFRNFRTAVHCSNVAQNSYCKFEKAVAFTIKDSYTLFCITGSEKETGGRSVSGASHDSAAFVFIIFALLLQLVRGISHLT